MNPRMIENTCTVEESNYLEESEIGGYTIADAQVDDIAGHQLSGQERLQSPVS